MTQQDDHKVAPKRTNVCQNAGKPASFSSVLIRMTNYMMGWKGYRTYAFTAFSDFADPPQVAGRAGPTTPPLTTRLRPGTTRSQPSLILKARCSILGHAAVFYGTLRLRPCG